MNTDGEILTTSDGWVYRLYLPERLEKSELYLMFHGWTGDENSMWIFTSRLPENACWLSLRGPFRATYGGYSWLSPEVTGWPSVEDFKPTITRILLLLENLRLPNIELKKINILGFSLGAALGLALCLEAPDKVLKFAGLSGFIPSGYEEEIQPGLLRKKKIFLAHGTQDPIVPLHRAKEATQALRKAGAQVMLCEDDVGHKLSASCFRAMQKYFENKTSKA